MNKERRMSSGRAAVSSPGPGLPGCGKTIHLEDREREAYERLQRLVSRLGISAPLIFDVGANIGQSIEKFRQTWPKAEIHSFEPNPPSFDAMAKRWGRARGVVLNRLALSDSAKRVRFHATRVPEAASLLSPTERMRRISTERKYDYEIIEMRTKTLDRYCNEAGCSAVDILKIDVQGAELAVLKGARGQLRKGAVTAIYVETTFADCYEGQTSYADLIHYLESLEYELWDISPFLYTSRDRIWAANSIFLSKRASDILER